MKIGNKKAWKDCSKVHTNKPGYNQKIRRRGGVVSQKSPECPEPMIMLKTPQNKKGYHKCDEQVFRLSESARCGVSKRFKLLWNKTIENMSRHETSLY